MTPTTARIFKTISLGGSALALLTVATTAAAQDREGRWAVRLAARGNVAEHASRFYDVSGLN